MSHRPDPTGHRLTPVIIDGQMPQKRGWYRLLWQQSEGMAGRQLYLDLGAGFNRHHSISLPVAGNGCFLRLPRSLRTAAVRGENDGGLPIIRFAPVSVLRSGFEWIADGIAAVFARAIACRDEDSEGIAMRWGGRGLRMVPFGERRFPARTAYALWRERYPQAITCISFRPDNIEICAGNADAGRFNELVGRGDLEWIGLVRGGVNVEPEAFAHLLQRATATGASIAYADSDRIDERGRRCDPCFRTSFSPEWLLSEDWLGPLLLISAAAARRAGGWRESAGQALHYDLCLRILQTDGSSGFAHLPLILASESGPWQAASSDFDKVRQAAIKARGLGCAIFGLAQVESSTRIADQATVIIPTRDRLDLLRPAIESLCGISKRAPAEIIIVDNGSREPETLEWLDRAGEIYPGLKVLRDDGDFNFARLCNDAARVAKGKVLAFLNNDTVIRSPLWLEHCGELAVQPGIGCVGPLLVYPNGRVQHAGMVTGVGGIAGHVWSGHDPHRISRQIAPLVTRNVSGLTGACLILTKAAFDSVGGFDDEHLGVAFNDLDLCLRLSAAGLRHVIVPWCQVVHLESQSRESDDYRAHDARFRAEFDWVRERWGEIIDSDPYFPRPLRIDRSRPIPFWKGH